MCGITGWTSIYNHLDRAAFLKATDALTHRGPESAGYYFNENNTLALGHRRLKIIDLSDASAQPFSSSCGRYIITYNGEIYNYKEIAHQLQLTLKTNGDTEVIIEAFAKIGIKSFAMLNGIFAFCIYDTQEDKFFLCRDRMGIKPLFYYFDGKQFAFASEIKAINTLPSIRTEINRNVFPEFLHLGFLTEPNTIYKHIYKFPAGSFLVLNVKNINAVNTFEFEKFWSLSDNILPEAYTNEAEVEKELEALLLKAIESQMISDVPLGTFLSGGIDSSLITALASKVKRDKIKTFSIGFEDSRHDESPFADRIAKELGTEHYNFKLSEKDLDEILHHMISAYDGPFFDSSALPTMFISKKAKEHVTVALSGDGGDELFMGYGMHRWASRLDQSLIAFLRKPLFIASKQLHSRYHKAGWMLNYRDYKTITTHIFSQEQYLFGEKDLNHYLVNTNYNFNRINDIPKTSRTLSPKERQSFWDINYYLRDDLLVKMDRSSMLYSLESRVPLLDNDIIDYAINIDTNLKYRNHQSKYILKKILFKYLPKELFNRPKRGFSVPLSIWLKGNLKFLIEKYLSPVVINRYDIVCNLYVQELKNRFFAGEDYLYARIWALITLHWWLEENT